MEPPESAQTNAGFWSLLVNETRFDKAHLLVERASGDVEQIALDQQDLSASWILGNMLRIDIPVSASPVKALYRGVNGLRSEEHTSEIQALMRISYAVFCLIKQK